MLGNIIKSAGEKVEEMEKAAGEKIEQKVEEVKNVDKKKMAKSALQNVSDGAGTLVEKIKEKRGEKIEDKFAAANGKRVVVYVISEGAESIEECIGSYDKDFEELDPMTQMRVTYSKDHGFFSLQYQREWEKANCPELN